jgi:hypothetical protein
VVTVSTRAVIQPNKAAVAGGNRLLSLSEGWLVDRGFMWSLTGVRASAETEQARARILKGSQPAAWAINPYPI